MLYIYYISYISSAAYKHMKTIFFWSRPRTNIEKVNEHGWWHLGYSGGMLAHICFEYDKTPVFFFYILHLLKGLQFFFYSLQCNVVKYEAFRIPNADK